MKLLVRLLTLFLIFIPLHNVHAQIDLRMGGYVQTWMIGTEYQESAADTVDTWGFRLRRARLTGFAQISEKFSATTWIELAGPDRNMIDFHMDIHFSRLFNIRAGQFIPAGQTFDTGRLVSSRLIFDERPVMTRNLSNHMGFEFFRDIGVMAYGQTDKLWYGIHVGNGAGRFRQAGPHIRNRSFGSGLYGARVDYTLIEGLQIGGHASINKQSDVRISGTNITDITNYSASVRLATNDFGIQRIFTETEVAFGHRDNIVTLDYSGLYTQIGYKITPETHLLFRYDYYHAESNNTLIQEHRGYNIGAIHYIFQDGKEISRMGLNARLGNKNPNAYAEYSVIAWFQVRFIPVR